MISVIVCSNNDPSWQVHEKHVEKTIGCDYEYLRVDNRETTSGICAAYNWGVKNALGEILVFMHEDVFLVTLEWGRILEKKFNNDANLGIVGVAGTQYLFKENPFWAAAGRPFIYGKVIHEDKNMNRYILTVFSQEKGGDVQAVAVDGLFFAARKSLFDTVKFDVETFDGFHFYDIDLCMQVRRTHKIIVTNDILLKHLSGGAFDDVWKQYCDKFMKKYRDELPVSCTNLMPGSTKNIPFESIDLSTVMNPIRLQYIKDIDEETEKGSTPMVIAPGSERVIVVTGMHRSGTSCITGLLNKCGYPLGTSHKLLNDNVPQYDNQKGHFENLAVVNINDAILNEAGGSWDAPPAREAIRKIENVIGKVLCDFAENFNGTIIKDPRLCITLDLWKKYYPNLKAVVICFRNPLSVAASLEKRGQGISLENGLKLWYTYNKQLIENIKGIPVFVINYDNLLVNLNDTIYKLLQSLGSDLSKEEMRRKIEGFYDKDLNHNIAADEELAKLSQDIKTLYNILKSKAL